MTFLCLVPDGTDHDPNGMIWTGCVLMLAGQNVWVGKGTRGGGVPHNIEWINPMHREDR